MNNYLSYRWPGGAPKDRTAEERRASARSARRRRLGLNLAALILALALLVGLLSGGWMLSQTLLRRLAGATGQMGSGGDRPAPIPSARPSSAPALTLPRAETGLGATLELDTAFRPALSAQELYSQTLPSVVSVSAQHGGYGGYSMGTGVIMREDGYILTNYHVIKDSGAVDVMLLADQSRYGAKLVGYDESFDIAVLKIAAQGLTAARFGDSDLLRVGDPVYAIGNPMGYLYGTMTGGMVSYLNREQRVGGFDMTLIQTSAAINSGSSGGALVNERGQVVGITVAKISGDPDDVSVESLSFAIPISAVRPYVNHILDTGETWRPTIGIQCYAGVFDGVPGIYVASVDPGVPALEAGLQPGDVIVSAQGKAVDSLYSLKRILADVGVGGTLTCTVLRDGGETVLSFGLIDSAQLEQ